MERIRRFNIQRDKIGFLKAILDCYEYIGLLTVVNGKEGLVEICYPKEMEEVLFGIIEEIDGPIKKEEKDV